jgi:hypothetical protein
MSRPRLVLLGALGPFAVGLALITGWRFVVPYLGVALFVLSTMIAATNFSLSFLRVPVLRARGIPDSQIRNISGIPLVGMLVVPAVYLVPESPWVVAWAISVLAIDTGNLVWFAFAVWKDPSFVTARR